MYTVYFTMSLKSGPGVVFPTIFNLYSRSKSKLAKGKLNGRKRISEFEALFPERLRFIDVIFYRRIT